MTWYLGGIRIYVEDDSGWKPTPRKGTIELLDTSSSIIHTSGRESHQRDVTFVIFSGYYSDIVPLVDDASVNFTDDDGVVTAVSIMGTPTPERLYDYHDRKVHRVKMTLQVVD